MVGARTSRYCKLAGPDPFCIGRLYVTPLREKQGLATRDYHENTTLHPRYIFAWTIFTHRMEAHVEAHAWKYMRRTKHVCTCT